MKYSTYTWDLVQALESASPAPCKTPATFIDSIRPFEDIPLLLDKCSKYKKVRGCTLNTYETKGLLIQTNTVATICKKYPITWCTDKFVRILGVHFNNDYDHTKYFNINGCIRQMEEWAKTQSKRNLSLKGRTIVINILILSKLWFIANVFRIPKDLTAEINKITFGFV